MKKILLISITVALVVGCLALYLLVDSQDSELKDINTEKSTLANEETSKVAAPISGTDSMKALMTRGENLECTVSYYTDEKATTPTTGSFFTSRGRLRGDFVVSDAGTEMLSSMIMTDNTLYTWSVVEGEKYGMKISLDALEASKNNDKSPEAREVVPLDAAVTYNCKEWSSVDGSVFEAPTDVIFKDFSDLMSTGMDFGNVYSEEAAGESKEIQCSLCDQVEGEGKAECRAMFACE